MELVPVCCIVIVPDCEPVGMVNDMDMSISNFRVLIFCMALTELSAISWTVSWAATLEVGGTVEDEVDDWVASGAGELLPPQPVKRMETAANKVMVNTSGLRILITVLLLINMNESGPNEFRQSKILQ